MSFLSFLGDIFKPASELIDNMHTSEEEKQAAKLALTLAQNEMAGKFLDYEDKLMKAQSDIIIAEATSDGTWVSMLKQSWRPITMLTFLALIVADAFGFLSSPLSPEAWELLKLGIGGYIIGRSAEAVTRGLPGNRDADS